MQSLRSNS